MYLDNHPSVKSFCYSQQAIPVELENQEAYTMDQVIDWAQEQDQDPVIKSVNLRLENKLRQSELSLQAKSFWKKRKHF